MGEGTKDKCTWRLAPPPEVIKVIRNPVPQMMKFLHYEMEGPSSHSEGRPNHHRLSVTNGSALGPSY